MLLRLTYWQQKSVCHLMQGTILTFFTASLNTSPSLHCNLAALRKPHFYTKIDISKERNGRYQSKSLETIQSGVYSLFLIKPWMQQGLSCGWTLPRINLHNRAKEINVDLCDVSRHSRPGGRSIILFEL